MSGKIWAVVPAGGVGSRMNSAIAKQYLALHGRPLILRTLERLFEVSDIDALVLGVAVDDAHWPALAYQHSKLAAVVTAGAERVDTVAQCLRYIVEQGGENDWALVHDAARPCVRSEDIRALIKTVLQQQRGGILAVPLSDTIKRGVPDREIACVEKTVSREHLWRAMTPQMFPVGTLLSAIEAGQRSGYEMTDEASAMEACGEKPLLLPCAPDNIKITLPQDLALAGMILRAQQDDALQD